MGIALMFLGALVIYCAVYYHMSMDDLNHQIDEDLKNKVKDLVEEKRKADNSQKFDIES